MKKIKLIKKGNTYKRVNWFKQNEEEIYIVLCTIVGFWCFVLAALIRG